MANTITKQTLIDGDRNLVVHIHIDGDGSGEETDTVLIDASTYAPAFTNSKLIRVEATLNGFTIDLNWDATTNIPLISIPDYDFNVDFSRYGGITNNTGVGKTGDVVFTTTGLGATDHGFMILEFKKKQA